MKLWALWTVQTVFPTDEIWLSLLQLLIVTALLAPLALLALPQVLTLRQHSRVITFTATGKSLQQACASAAARLNRLVPLPAAIGARERNADGQARMRRWASWAVQTVFPKQEAWFGLPQLLTITALLATLALLAVPQVLVLRQKNRVVTITVETSPVQYADDAFGLAGRGGVRGVWRTYV